jgi:dynein heavy chain 1
LADIEPLLADSAFLNKLQQDVNTWIRDIQKVTILTKDPPLRSTRGELDFWLDMEKGLLKLEAALRADTVSLTLSILKRAKRFHATVSFLSDTGLKDALDTVVKYNVLMKDFPIT